MKEEKRILKKRLQEIKMNDYQLPQEINYFDLTLKMLNNIGDVDPELRDDLIYLVLGNWILREVFSTNELQQILDILLDERHLFYKIGEKGTDSVFTRSFSVLMIPLILSIHINKPFLSKEEVKKIKTEVIRYVKEEQDVRGYVQNKGWAHSAAHGADALDELAKCNYLGKDDMLQILRAIQNKISINNYIYFNGEDERMTTAVVSVLKRKLLDDIEIKNWIEDLTQIEKTGDFSIDHKLKTNIKTFLRSLYFRILDDEDLRKYIPKIREELKKLK